ncbi:MAG: hypothetical protein ACOX6T_13335 [Myxococcales bacterium]
MPVALLLALGACRCGDGTALTTFFTDLRYTRDGRALVLEATDGLYAASPATDDPRRLTAEHCTSSTTYALDCVRVSPDGARVAALLRPTTEGERELDIFELHQWRFEDLGEERASKVADGVIDAAYTPDGRELVWVRLNAYETGVAVYRLGPGEVEEELIAAITLGAGDPADAMGTVVLTSFGVAYPRVIGKELELWLRTFDGELLDIGRLPVECAGTALAGCVFPSPDGTSLVWQEEKSGVIHVYRVHRQLDLPLGQGYGFAFSRSGAFALRMGYSPEAAYVQRMDTAALVRGAEAISAELSFDGETLARLVVESKALGTARLFIGPSRQDGRDNDYGVFTGPPVRPLFGSSVGFAEIDHGFTGDGRYLVVAEKGEGEGMASLVAVNAFTSERLVLGELGCADCCVVAPEGALVVCLPAPSSSVNGAWSIDLYDPATGKRTRASESAIDVQPLNDGSGVAVQQYSGDIPELLVVTKDGRSASLGATVRFAVSPTGPQIARINSLGSLEVGPLP